MPLEANDGQAIRASSPFSMKKNRWAAEISIDREPLADGTLATCRVKTMLGGCSLSRLATG
jgi:hypothetical protein